MKNNYFKIIVFFLVFTCGCSLFQASDDGSQHELSYISKVKRDLIVLQEYVYRQISSVLNIDLGAARMLARLKADIRKQYPCEQDFEGLQVRQGTDLCQSERNFIENRMQKVSQALQQHFDIDIPLKIAFCTSGGGNRAMLTTLGFYLGAQDIGLFDTALYSAGVSGSTWTTIPWSYCHAKQEMSLVEFKDQLTPRLNKTMGTVNRASIPPMIEEYQKNIITNNIAKHFAYDQSLTSIDVYSGFIGNYALFPAGENRLDVTWSSIADTIEQGNMPLPMGAAVSYKRRESTKSTAEYYWFEIGPFEVGSDQIGAYVPTKAFGSKFNMGKPVDGYAGNAPEYPLSFYMGVFGSVFAVSLHEIMDRVTKQTSFTLFGRTIVLPIDLWIRSSYLEFAQDVRFAPATFHNYAYGLSESPISTLQKIRLYDGAMNFNFPLPLLMRPSRQLDVIIISDSAANLSSLKMAKLHSQRNGIKFPDITHCTKDMIRSKLLIVLNDPRLQNYDKNMVTILHCPFIKNDGFSEDFNPILSIVNGYCNTFNFKYTKEQAEQVVGLARYNISSLKSEIKEVFQALQKQKVLQVPASVDKTVFIR